jgi:hypothetical protein
MRVKSAGIPKCQAGVGSEARGPAWAVAIRRWQPRETRIRQRSGNDQLLIKRVCAPPFRLWLAVLEGSGPARTRFAAQMLSSRSRRGWSEDFKPGSRSWEPAAEGEIPRRPSSAAGSHSPRADEIFRRAFTEPPNWIAGERSPMSGLTSSAVSCQRSGGFVSTARQFRVNGPAVSRQRLGGPASQTWRAARAHDFALFRTHISKSMRT